MIIGHLQLIDSAIEVSETFQSFTSEDFKAFLYKIIEFETILEKNLSITQAEVILKIELNDTPENNEDIKKLIEKLSRASQIVFQIEIINPNADSYHHRLQSELDTAYCKSLQTWHKHVFRQEQTDHGVALQALISPPKGIHLAVITQELEPSSSHRLTSTVSRRPDRLMLTPHCEKTNLKTHPNFHAYQQIVSEFTDINTNLEAFGGIYGMLSLFSFLQKLPDMASIKTFKDLFLKANPVNIQDLMSPSGRKLFEICLNWPPLLFKHFLNMVARHHDTEPKRLETFILKMQGLWEKIEVYNVFLNPEIESYEYDFFQRIDHMHTLVENVAPGWRAYQVKYIFDLNWKHKARIQSLLETNGCQWIHPKMFDADIRIQEFYIDAARFMKRDALDTMKTYLEYLKTPPSNSEKFKLLSWFLSFSPTPNLEELRDIILWFEQQSIANQQTLVHFCLTQLVEGQINYETFQESFQLAKDKHFSLVSLLDYQYQWRKAYPQLKDVQWQNIFNLIGHHDKRILENLLPMIMAKPAEKLNTIYFKTLITLIFSDSSTHLSALLSVYNNYEGAKQDSIISILRSLNINPSYNKPSAEDLLHLLNAHVVSNPSQILQQSEWQKAYPLLEFNYFHNHINYQQIFDSLERICQKLSLSIKSITQLNIFGWGINTLLLESVLNDLQAQEQTLNSILLGLQQLKISDSQHIELDGSFSELQKIEEHFDGFFNRKLGDSFIPVLLSLLPRLDSCLNKDSSMKELFGAILKNFDKVPSAIADFFNKDLLNDMQSVDGTQSIVAKMMDTQLVSSIRQEIQTLLDTNLICHESIQPYRLEPLQFLGKMSLNQKGIVDFFSRLQNFTIITSEWPKIEAKCFQFQEAPLAIWQLCIRYQQLPNANSYWRGCFDILELLFKHHDHLDQIGPKNFIQLFEIIIREKINFPEELGANGEINHPSWAVFLNFLDKCLASPDIYQNPSFLCLLPLGIQSTLKSGQEFKFSQMTVMFAQLGDHDNLFLPILVQSLEQANEYRRQKTQILIGKLGPILKASQSRPWLDLLRILLTPETLANKIDDILKIIDCVEQHPEFDLINVIINDSSRFESLFIDKLSQFIDCFNHLPSAWAQTYHKTFKAGVEKITHEEADLQPQTPTNASNSIWNLWGLLKKSALLEKISTSKITTPALHASAELPNFWPIIALYPYPNIEQLSFWLSESNPENVTLHIQAFDVTPTNKPLPIPMPNELDFSRWIQELECYDGKWSSHQKQKLKSRLQQIWTQGTSYCSKSRTTLIQRFHELCLQLRASNTLNAYQLENELLALLSAIYQKIDQKMPYPTQLLALLMVLEYGAEHLIEEVDTSEGKATIIAILAILKWSRRADNTVLIYTHTRDLVVQDFYHKKHHFLFTLLNIHADIIYEHSSPTSLKANGIYYTTHDDYRIFRKKQCLSGIHDDFPMDVIVDEVDELILDQTTKINLVKINPQTQEMSWIYPQINLFVQSHLKAADMKCPPPIWGLKLKQSLLEQNRTSFERMLKLKAIGDEKWLNWIKASLYVHTLTENTDFIVQEIESEDGPLFTTVPFINGLPKDGCQIAYLAFEGIPQLLHAKLTTPQKSFIIEDETSIISQLPSIDFRHVSHFTGFSGSIGEVRELFSLQEILRAKSIRVGRYHHKALDEHPSLLLKNKAQLHAKISDLLALHEQPFLIFAGRIEEAQEIFNYLKTQQQQNKLLHKHLKLITGQEFAASRQQWLKNDSEIKNYAGKKNCVTIATLICGRGTDIIINLPKGLFGITTNIFPPRAFCQIKGRAARAGHHGDFISLYNASQLRYEWSFLNLPHLSQETLSCWIQSIQKFMLFSHSKERLLFSKRAWCEFHLNNYLDHALMTSSPETIKKAQTKLRELLDLTWEKTSLEQANFNTCKTITLAIWKSLFTYLVVLGIKSVSTLHTQDAFEKYLRIPNPEEMQTIINSPNSEDFFINDDESVPSLKPSEENSDTSSEDDLSRYRDANSLKLETLCNQLINLAPLESKQNRWLDYLTSPFFYILAWFNPSAQKIKQYLNQTWDDFAKKPNLENWSNFYTTLLSAESLQNRQAQKRFWRIDYWFKSWNPLGKWCEFKLTIDQSFKEMFSKRSTDIDPIHLAIKNASLALEDNTYSGLLNPFTERRVSIIFFFMRRLFPQTYNILNKMFNAWELLRRNPNNSVNRQDFFKQQTELNAFYQKYHHHHLLPFSYWRKFFKLWQMVGVHFENAHQESLKLPSNLIEWQTKVRDQSQDRLRYFGHLMCQEQIKTNDIRFYFNLFSSSQFLSQIQQEYDSNKKTSDLELEIDELSRYYPQQLKSIFNQYNPARPIGLGSNLTAEERKRLCIEVLKNYFVPPNDSTPISMIVHDRQLQVLRDELDQLSKNRLLLCFLRA